MTATPPFSLQPFLRSLGAMIGLHPAPAKPEFSEHEAAALLRLQAGPRQGLDQQSWRDLLGRQYFDHLSAGAGIFGKQELYRRLRGGVGAGERDASVARVRALVDEPSRRDVLQAACQPLRDARAEAATVLFDEQAVRPVPRWLAYARWLPLLLVLAVLLTLFAPQSAVQLVSLLAVVPVTLALFGLELHFDTAIQAWNGHMTAVFALLAAVGVLGAVDDGFTRRLGALRADARRIGGKLARRTWMSSRIAVELFDFFTLGRVRHYFKQQRVIGRERALLREMYMESAKTEADVVLARYLDGGRVYCWADMSGERGLALDGAVHPLIDAAQPLSLAARDKGVFLTGQNGVGKSTLLRTVGINAAAARAFGFCHARQAALPDLCIHASIQNDDSLFDGESLYLSELRRARELLATRSQLPTLYLIDEIFRGTNYLESVSVAAAFLDSLAGQGLVIVSSHNGVLGPLLAHNYDAVHVVRDEVDGQLALREGVLAKTNGIALLGSSGFSGEVQANAEKVFSWLSQYLAHPTRDVQVLSPKGAGQAS